MQWESPVSKCKAKLNFYFPMLLSSRNQNRRWWWSSTPTNDDDTTRTAHGFTRLLSTIRRVRLTNKTDRTPFQTKFSTATTEKTLYKRIPPFSLPFFLSCYVERPRLLPCSMTRVGDLLHFWQLFKASDSNHFTQIAHNLGNFLKVSKSYIFLVESFLDNFYRHLATFYSSHCCRARHTYKGMDREDWNTLIARERKRGRRIPTYSMRVCRYVVNAINHTLEMPKTELRK